MHSFLSEITAVKLAEVAERKKVVSLHEMQSRAQAITEARSLKSKTKNNPDDIFLIAEFKKSSPSLGSINASADLQSVAKAYERGGASAISVLTEEQRFSGKITDLGVARSCCKLPVLRKDFIVDPYQIFEAKQAGADLILLIAEALTPDQLKEFALLAHSVGLEVLLEFHEASLLEVCTQVAYDFLGVNCRNLKTLKVDWTHLLKVAPLLPAEATKVAESGINSEQQIQKLHQEGYRGFLVGEFLMRNGNPQQACQQLLSSFDVSQD
jgi:indole-3-glycerol phosphate synthase